MCGRQPSDPHHLRFAQPRALGLKVSDEFTVPLCRGHHRQLHQAGDEAAWWDNALSRAFWNIPSSDLAFDLSNPTIPIYAHEILVTALGWDSYEKYLGEMTELLP